MSHDSSHATILIRRSTTRGLPVEDGTGKSLIQVSEIAYSLLGDTNDDGLGNGGDRLYIGAGNVIYEPDVNSQGDSVSHYYSSEIHTIGGKYFTDMMNHQRGIVTAASSLLVDDDKKLNELLVDFLYFNKDSVSTEATNDLVLRGGTGLTKVTGDLQVTQNVQIDGTLTVDGIATLKAGSSGTITVGDQNTDNVVFGADINSSLIPNITDTYDLGTALQRWRTLHVREAYLDSATFNIVQIDEDLNVDGLTTLDSTTIDGDLQVSQNFNVDGLTTLDSTTIDGDLVVTQNFNVDGLTTLDSTTIDGDLVVTQNFTLSTLTDNRVVIVGPNGILEDDANLTFDATTLQVGVDFNVDGLTTLDSTTIDGDLKVTDLINDQVVIVGPNGILEGDANFTFDATTLQVGVDFNVDGLTTLDSTTINGDLQVSQNLNVDGLTTLDSTTIDGDLKVTDLINDQVVIVGPNGILEGDANFTFDATTLQVGVDFNVDGLTTLDSTTIDGDLIVNKNLFVYGEQTNISTTELLVEDQQIVIANGTPTAVLANGAGIAIGDSASPYAYARYANNGVDSARWEFSPKIYAQSIEFEVIDCGTYA